MVVKTDYIHPILSCAQSREWEETILGKDSERQWEAMNRAGSALADSLYSDIPECMGKRAPEAALVLVGKGHNGGDAIIALRHILNRFGAMRAFLVFPLGLTGVRPLVRRCLDDLQAAHSSRLSFASLRKGNTQSIESQIRALIGVARIDLCLDGILGMQFRPPLRSPVRELVEVVNGMKAIALRAAVDVPSGLGDNSDDLAFKVDFTYATGIAKRPLFEAANRSRTGRIRYLDLGFFDGDVPANTATGVLTGGILKFRRVLRDSQAHKKTFGHLFVVGGSANMPGAILMAVRAALKSGVGLVTAFVPESIAAEAAANSPEAMWVALPQNPADGGLALEGMKRVLPLVSRATGWVIGPGMGTGRETEALIKGILDLSDQPVLLDADALQPSIVGRDWGGRRCVLTPHAGEFIRLSKRSPGDLADPSEVMEFAGSHHLTVCLKGSPTRIVQGRSVIHSLYGGPVLARGGSGDLLAGLVGGRIALPGEDFAKAVCQGVAWHGWAADRLAREKGQVAAKATGILDFL